VYDLPCPVHPVLHKDKRDLGVVDAYPADVYLCLNAGYSVLSRHTTKPVFVYCHGNDYLDPWIDVAAWYAYPLEDVTRRLPFFWRYGSRVRQLFHRRAVARGLRAVAGIFVNSDYTQRRLTAAYPGIRCTVDVSYPGVRELFFEALAPASGRARRGWRFLTVARLATHARRKNVENVLRACAKLKDAHGLDFELLVIGDGDLKARFEQMAGELNLTGHVRFLGGLPTADVRDWMDRSDMFVLPAKASARDVEAFGIVYAEAAARGLPSLASRAGGATDAVSHMRSGIVIETSDADAIAEGMLAYVRNAARFDPACVRAWAERFRWERTTAIIRQRLRAATAGGTPGSRG
jgi:glycosyltransferase involved in cell wall biosynthesis